MLFLGSLKKKNGIRKILLEQYEDSEQNKTKNYTIVFFIARTWSERDNKTVKKPNTQLGKNRYIQRMKNKHNNNKKEGQSRASMCFQE